MIPYQTDHYAVQQRSNLQTIAWGSLYSFTVSDRLTGRVVTTTRTLSDAIIACDLAERDHDHTSKH